MGCTTSTPAAQRELSPGMQQLTEVGYDGIAGGSIRRPRGRTSGLAAAATRRRASSAAGIDAVLSVDRGSNPLGEAPGALEQQASSPMHRVCGAENKNQNQNRRYSDDCDEDEDEGCMQRAFGDLPRGSDGCDREGARRATVAASPRGLRRRETVLYSPETPAAADAGVAVDKPHFDCAERRPSQPLAFAVTPPPRTRSGTAMPAHVTTVNEIARFQSVDVHEQLRRHHTNDSNSLSVSAPRRASASPQSRGLDRSSGLLQTPQSRQRGDALGHSGNTADYALLSFSRLSHHAPSRLSDAPRAMLVSTANSAAPVAARHSAALRMVLAEAPASEPLAASGDAEAFLPTSVRERELRSDLGRGKLARIRGWVDAAGAVVPLPPLPPADEMTQSNSALLLSSEPPTVLAHPALVTW
jgi:hypothetical protein